MTAQHIRHCRGAAGVRAGLRPFLIAMAFASGLCAEEYLVMEETWSPGGVNGWSAPAKLLTLSASGGSGFSGVLRGQFAQQVFPFPDSDAFTAVSGTSMGKFAHDYFSAGQRVPLWMGCELLAEDVLPSSCLIRLTGGVGTTNTFFRSVLSQLTAPRVWSWIEVPLGDVSGWTGGTAAQFSNALENVTRVELRLTRNGLAAQDYLVDNFAVVWRIADPVTDTDGDGLPDFYEFAHTNSATGMQPEDDDDHDGASNGEEYDTGSDPHEAGSLFAILHILKPAAGPAQLTVRSLPGRNYQIERTSDLGFEPEPLWEAIGAPQPGAGPRLTLSDSEPVLPACFYRVRVTR